MPELNILFTSVGRRVSLIRQFLKAHNDLGLSGSLFTTDLKTNAPASHVTDHFIQAPRIDSPDFIPFLLDMCKRQQIGLLFPLIDTELLPIASNAQAFRDIGTTPVVSDVETIKISMDKRTTSDFFSGAGVMVPTLLGIEEVLLSDDAVFPLMLKPARGSGSVGVTKIKNREELRFFSSYVDDAMVQEFIEGDEFTLDILSDFSGNVRCVVPRLRMETRAGEISKGKTVKNRAVMEAGARVVSKLPGAVGCITVQCFLTSSGDTKFIEINPRFGGGAPLAIEAGADYPRWLMEMHLGRTPDISMDGWQDGLTMLRYDDAIFVAAEGGG